MLHAGRVERRPPPALVVAGELKVEALVGHADGDTSDPGPRIEVGAEKKKGTVSRRKTHKAECCTQELAALVEHTLLMS